MRIGATVKAAAAGIRGAAIKVAAQFDLRDVFAFAGIGCAAYGTAQIYPPAAWIITGVALFWLAVRQPRA